MNFLIAFSFMACTSTGQMQDVKQMSEVEPGLIVNDTANDFRQLPLEDENGKPVSLASFHGKIVYVSVWASSCGSSVASFPYQMQLLKRLQAIALDSSIHLINMHVEDPRKSWIKSMRKHRPPGINLYCTDTAVLRKWKLRAPPVYLLLDKAGQLISVNAPQPAEAGTIDFILYSLVHGREYTSALELMQTQQQLMTAKKSATALNDEFYKKWFFLTIKTLVEFQEWRTEHQKK